MNHVRGKGGILLGALVYSALATGAFSGAPVANATCVSAFGINNGNGCTSNPTSFAIGIGAGAVANASLGFFGGALAIGTNASATNAVSALTLAAAVGDDATAGAALSVLGMALQLGPGTAATAGALDFAIGASAGGTGTASSSAAGIGSVSLQLGPGTTATLGLLNLAIGASAGGTGTASSSALGVGNASWQLGPGSAATVGLTTGIIRAMGGTGKVVTNAGLVFAFTMAAMVFSDLRIIGRVGTTIGLGLLFDTLVVRSFMTPSIAALLGRWFWWPQIVRPRPASQMLRDTPPRPVVRDLLLRDEDRDDAVTIELPRSRVP